MCLGIVTHQSWQIYEPEIKLGIDDDNDDDSDVLGELFRNVADWTLPLVAIKVQRSLTTFSIWFLNSKTPRELNQQTNDPFQIQEIEKKHGIEH